MKILFFQIRLKPFLSVFDFIDVFGEAEKKFALFNIIIFTFPKRDVSEYSCAVTPQVRQTGNRLSGLAGTAYASLLT